MKKITVRIYDSLNDVYDEMNMGSFNLEWAELMGVEMLNKWLERCYKIFDVVREYDYSHDMVGLEFEVEGTPNEEVDKCICEFIAEHPGRVLVFGNETGFYVGYTDEYYDDEFEDDDEDEYFESFDDEYAENMPCDTYGMCGGTSCPNFFKCHGTK